MIFKARISTVIAVFFVASSVGAITPEDKCEADKNKIAGKYAFCRQKAEALAVLKGEAADYSKCDSKLNDKWGKAEQKAIDKGTSCADSVSALDVQTFVTAHADAVAAALDGGDLPECGDGSVNAVGEQCDGADLDGENCGTLGFGGGTLVCDGSCGFDTSGCDANAFPASGQTTAWGAGSDGDVQAGAALSYTDNGDGTITDNNTGLMWEKKDDSGGIHDKDNTYSWRLGFFPMDGTIKTVFLDTLNDVAGGGTNCFAGYCDWRVPNVKELQGIVHYEDTYIPSVDPAFHQSVTCAGCSDLTLVTCSCTAIHAGLAEYWSSTTTGNISLAFYVEFGGGLVLADDKIVSYYVRAVRGGP